MSEESPYLYVKLFEDPLDVDWPSHGDELMFHMWKLLGQRVPMIGHRFQRHDPTEDEPFFYFGYTATSEVLTSSLVFVPTGAERVEAYARISAPEEVPDQVAPWAEALRDAVLALNAPHPEHRWWAVVGPAPQDLNSHRAVVADAAIGPLRVLASATTYVDATDQPDHPSLNGASLNATFPVVVEGSQRGYMWRAAAGSAVRDLKRLCAILSVAFDAEWRIRQAPDTLPLQAADLPRSRFPEAFPADDDNWQREEVSIPAWCSTAWDLVEQDGLLATALYAHYQGVALERRFPSQALLAYVGAVEGLGSKTEPLRRCDCCDGCTVMVGAGRRFRKALGLVLSPRERRSLEVVYDHRSKTAHEGRLHGDEMGCWSFGPDLFAPAPLANMFRYDTLRRMRAASRTLLLHFLAGDEASVR